MLSQTPLVVAAALAALLPMLPFGAVANEHAGSVQLAMMDMMPMGGGGAMPQAAPGAAPMPGMPGMPSGAAPGGMAMGDDMKPMGGGMAPMAPTGQARPMAPMGQAQPMAPMTPAGQAQAAAPTGQAQPMAGCSMMQTMMPAMQAMMRGGAMPQGSAGTAGAGDMGGAQPVGSSAARLEGRIAFLRTELRITEAQASAWDAFASTLRSGREHLDAARAALQDSTTASDPMARLESYESHLRARTDAVHLTRMAFNTLNGQLDESQKRAATVTMLPFIGSF